MTDWGCRRASVGSWRGLVAWARGVGSWRGLVAWRGVAWAMGLARVRESHRGWDVEGH
ncbi:MAG: hypothetical protein HKL85_03115 [Acidimicrobiaceae bacterium]|nr:hypothetical protein [Acidimicrobiaceae bacterium]